MTTTATPTRKLAFRLERGNLIRRNRRTYRVVRVVPTLVIPRNSRVSRVAPRTVYKVVMVRVTDRCQGHSTSTTFEQNDVVTLVTK